MAREMTVKTPAGNPWALTRRELLSAGAAAALGLLPAAESCYGQVTQHATSRPAVAASHRMPWWLRAERTRARVVDVRSAGVSRPTAINMATLSDMLDQGTQVLTGAASPTEAWRSILGSAERIVIKFNSVGARVLKTTEPLAKLLVQRVGAAGYDQEQITLVEAPAPLANELGTARAARGWGGEIEVGGRPEQLAQYLFEADAIINVPFLKTHQIAGMTGCLKNLSHALVRHPMRYHANGCSPYVGQVVGAQEVSSRIKLNLVNALRVVVDHGPDARAEDIVEYGGLLFGFDPLAVDNVGLSILAVERKNRGLEGGLTIRHLASAAEMGVGRWRPADIDRVAVGVDG